MMTSERLDQVRTVASKVKELYGIAMKSTKAYDKAHMEWIKRHEHLRENAADASKEAQKLEETIDKLICSFKVGDIVSHLDYPGYLWLVKSRWTTGKVLSPQYTITYTITFIRPNGKVAKRRRCFYQGKRLETPEPRLNTEESKLTPAPETHPTYRAYMKRTVLARLIGEG